jgi:hypothetical protein
MHWTCVLVESPLYSTRRETTFSSAERRFERGARRVPGLRHST